MKTGPAPAPKPAVPAADGRVVLITGAAGGLGQALVKVFATAGWSVAAGYHHTPLPPGPPEVWGIPLDVTREASVAAAVTAVTDRWQRLDALVNNAGVLADALLARLDEADWQRVLDTNLKGAFLCSRAALRPMLRQREGHVINIASFGGRVGRAGQTAYAASKAGLLGLTQSLARETGSRNIRVNAVLPGFLRTRLVGELSEEQLAGHAAANALGRLNDPVEAARFIEFLAGTHNISGQIFQLDSRIGPWT